MAEKRQRKYREKVKCSICLKTLDSDYKTNHKSKWHKNESPVFTPILPEDEPSPDKEATSTSSTNVNYENIEMSDLTSDLHPLPLEEPQQNESINSVDLNVNETVTETVNDYPQQPILENYDRKKFGNESFTRDFDSNWFKKYPWLNFSVASKTASCFACKRFLQKDDFIFSNWKKTDRLLKHQKSQEHCLAMEKWFSHRDCKRKNISIAKTLDSQHQLTVRENRIYLQKIIETLAYLAQQNVALRGKREDRSNLENRSDENRGNFLELLHLRCKDIPWLAQKLKSQLKSNKQWTTWKIQNELLEIMSVLVLETISYEVGNNYFSIIMDETTDASTTEQVSVCLSFVCAGVKKESFVGFYDTKRTDGKSLLNVIKKVVSDLNLQLEKIVGACFDGASNMSGKNKGVAGLLKEISPLSVYVHCYAHRLNLALSDSLSAVSCFKNTLGTVQSLYNFIAVSAKRVAEFKDTSVNSEILPLSLKSLSKTRWSCRFEAIKAVDEQLERIIKLLIKMKNDVESKPQITSDAKRLLISICEFEFLFSLKMLKFILSNTNALSKYLQGKNIDVFNARRFANLTISTLKTCRDEANFDLIWKRTLIDVENVKEWISSESASIKFKDLEAPRTKIPSKRLQALCGEIVTSTDKLDAKTHYRINTYFVGLDSVINEMIYRFQSKDADILYALGKVCLGEDPDDKVFEEISQFYEIDIELLKSEHRLFKNYVSKSENTVSTASDLISLLTDAKLEELLPLFASMAKIFASIPASSCSSERSFSTLRRLKTYLRSTMGQTIAVLRY